MTESIMSLQQFLRRLALGRRWVGDHEVSDSAANRHAFGDVGGADLCHEDGLAHSSSPSLCFDSVSVDLGRWCGAVALQRAGSPTELMKELMKLAAHADYQHHVWIQGDEE
jgi:hypothetical protein